MAEPTISTPQDSDAPEAKPRLVAVDPTPPAGGAAAGATTGAPQRRSRIVIWGLLALLVLAVAFATLQSQRLTALGETNLALTEELQALEVQLSAATLKVQTFEMQQDLVRAAAADIADRVSQLQALVERGPDGTPAPVERGPDGDPAPVEGP